MVGWADRPSARWAQRVARRRGIPYLALEDGFLRSVSLGQAGAPPLSLVLDRTGMYFDATRPSDLEMLLESDGWLDDTGREAARAAIALKNKHRLSKYNDAPVLALGPKARRRILVIDQTAGDASIAGALATRATFDAMLAAAHAENPGAEIVVKIHPATAGGYRAGCIDLALAGDARVLAQACDPIALLEQVDAVYTVSSLAGFEALLLGLPVHCFGLPFYAGWGATNDRLKSARRSKMRGAEEIFAASYMRYARYVDPLTGHACSVFDAIERLALFKTQAQRIAGPFACYGFAPWKHAPLRDVLGATGREVSFHASAAAANQRAKASDGAVAMWASRETPANRAVLTRDGVAVLRMEDGFLRSVGLGSDFHRASSFVLDDLGIYYDARAPSRLEVLLEAGAFDETLLVRAAALRARVVGAGLSKYNVGGAGADVFAGAGARQKVLVIGQVEDDASIRYGCAGIAGNAALLSAVRAAQPEAFLLYKEHPDVTAGNRRGRLTPQAARLADRVVALADIADCIAACDELHTMTSLAGFEALLRGKPVHVYGRPFYAGWGLTADRLDFPRRARRLTLDALVAGALIAYPLYIDPKTRLPCSAEFHLERLLEIRAAGPVPAPARGAMHAALRYLRAMRESVLARPTARI
jgi:capsular polysaccharide export protein